MIRFHVMSHQIIWLATVKCSHQIRLPLLTFATVCRIQHCNLLIVDKIGIITHALGHNILTLKKIDVEIIYTDILDGITNHIHIINICLQR